MTENEAVNIIHKELLQEEGFLIRLSFKYGIDQEAVTQLENAITFLTGLYKNREHVPKVVAAAFVDLTPWFERCLNLYSEDEQVKIMDLRDRIVSMAIELFNVE